MTSVLGYFPSLPSGLDFEGYMPLIKSTSAEVLHLGFLRLFMILLHARPHVAWVTLEKLTGSGYDTL